MRQQYFDSCGIALDDTRRDGEEDYVRYRLVSLELVDAVVDFHSPEGGRTHIDWLAYATSASPRPESDTLHELPLRDVLSRVAFVCSERGWEV